MKINFILNGEDVIYQGESGSRLIDILRGSFGLFGSKPGCISGQCGACTVICDGEVVPACLIPAFKIKGCEIITIEGFSQTNEYNEIITAFTDVHLGNCGYCEPGKILCAESLLDRFSDPTKEEILHAFSGIKCRCTNTERLILAVKKIADIRTRRQHGFSS